MADESGCRRRASEVRAALTSAGGISPDNGVDMTHVDTAEKAKLTRAVGRAWGGREVGGVGKIRMGGEEEAW